MNECPPEIGNHFKKKNIGFSTIIFFLTFFGGVIHLQSEHLPMQSLRKVPGPMGARFHGGEYSVLSVLFEDLVISGQIMVKLDEHHHQTRIMVYAYIYIYFCLNCYFSNLFIYIHVHTHIYMYNFLRNPGKVLLFSGKPDWDINQQKSCPSARPGSWRQVPS